MTWVIIWAITVIAAFVAGLFVFRNNAKKFNSYVNMIKGLPAEAQAQIAKLQKEIDEIIAKFKK